MAVFPVNRRLIDFDRRFKVRVIIPLAVLSLVFVCFVWQRGSSASARAGIQDGSNVDKDALIETLLHRTHSVAQSQGSRALARYVKEDGVKSAFIDALKVVTTDSARLNIIRALVRNFPTEPEVQRVLANVLMTERNSGVRVLVAESLGKYLDRPVILEAWIHALQKDNDDGIRLRVSSDLASKITLPEVYTPMLDVAMKDRCELLLVNALDVIERRVKDRSELRSFFMHLLEEPSPLIQYHGVKGLAALEDPSDKPMLVEKAKSIIAYTKDRPMNKILAQWTLQLLKGLDPQAAQAIRLE